MTDHEGDPTKHHLHGKEVQVGLNVQPDRPDSGFCRLLRVHDSGTVSGQLQPQHRGYISEQENQ